MEGGDCDVLQALADSRLLGDNQAPATVLMRDEDAQGRVRFTLELRQPEASSAAVAAALLSTFVEATTSSARARETLQLPRSVEIATAAATVGAATPPDPQQQTAAAPGLGAQRLAVQFTVTEPAAEEQIREAARLFEAYWQVHIKATKSDLHCRMRQRLGVLRQQLQLARFDGA